MRISGNEPSSVILRQTDTMYRQTGKTEQYATFIPLGSVLWYDTVVLYWNVLRLK